MLYLSTMLYWECLKQGTFLVSSLMFKTRNGILDFDLPSVDDGLHTQHNVYIFSVQCPTNM